MGGKSELPLRNRSDLGGREPIRRMGSGPASSAPPPKSELGERTIARTRSGALVLTQIPGGLASRRRTADRHPTAGLPILRPQGTHTRSSRPSRVSAPVGPASKRPRCRGASSAAALRRRSPRRGRHATPRARLGCVLRASSVSRLAPQWDDTTRRRWPPSPSQAAS